MTSSASEASQLTGLKQEEIHAALNLRFVAVAVLSLTLYDFVLRLKDEIDFIWKQRISIIKLLYLWQRYAGLLGILIITVGILSSNMNRDFCNLWFVFITWVSTLLVISTEVAVFLWIWALYNHDRRVIKGLSLLLLADIVVAFSLLAKYHAEPFLFQISVSTAGGDEKEFLCTTKGEPKGLPYIWVVTLINALVFHIMIFYQRRRLWSSVSASSWDISNPEGSNSVVIKFYTRSILIILPINILDLVCGSVWIAINTRANESAANSLPSSGPLAYLLAALCCNIVCSTRLLLDILTTYYREIKPPTDMLSNYERRALALDPLSSVFYVEDDKLEHNAWAYELRRIKFGGF